VKRRAFRRLTLDRLEDRLNLSVNAIFNGVDLTLVGSPDSGMLEVNQTAANTFNYVDGAFTSPDFTVTGNVTVNVNGIGDTVSINLDANVAPGNISVYLGNGGNLLLVTTGGMAGGIAGNLTVIGGTGIDAVAIGDPLDGDTIDVFGNLYVSLGNSFDALFITDGVTVSGNALFSNTNTTIIAGDVAGKVTATDTESFANLFVVTADSMIGGNLSYTSRNGSDVVILEGLVKGSATFNLGNGSNEFNMSGTVEKSLTVRTGSGADEIDLSDGAAILKNATVSMGNGSNVFTFDVEALVQGNLSITGGSDGDDLTDFNGTVLGRLSIDLKNGTNDFTFGPDAFVGGSSIHYRGGSGVDTVTFEGSATSARFTALLGAGADDFNLDSDDLAALTVDGGAGIDTFDTSVAITFPLVLKNIP
jgi:hypothetical protein